MENQMAHWARIVIIVGALLTLASEAGAQGFNPYSGKTPPTPNQPKAGDGLSPTTATGEKRARPTPAPGSGLLGTDNYKIGPRDVIEISVYGVPELSATTKVGDDGLIQLPLLGPTPVAGKTPEQLQKELTARLGADYLQNPQINVMVKEFNSRYVILTGAVKNGVIPLKGETTLLELIAGAGGFTDASDSTVLILREQGGKRSAAKFDVAAIEKGQAEDVMLQSGDRIVAGYSMIKKAYGGFLKALPIAGAFMMF
jgi:polysaccharide biosynthesis/export protein